MYIIKQLRHEMGINQSQLAEVVGVSLRTIQNYEKKDASIPTKYLTKIAAHFDLTIVELHQRQLRENDGSYSKAKSFIKHGCVFFPLDDVKHFVEVPLVLVEKQKNYIESLEKTRLGNSPFRSGFIIEFAEEDPYKAFEISGDSMNDGSIDAIPNKAIVLGVKTRKESFTIDGTLVIGKTYILVCKDRIICKKISGVDGDKNIQCHNLNGSPEYQDFKLPFEDVLEIFRIVKKQF